MKLLDFDNKCVEILNDLPVVKSRNCFRSAINHLNQAEKLFEIDSSMAAFRCITAEEEAATGLMLLLQDMQYANAVHLKPRTHAHKVAVIVFFSILTQFLEDHFKGSVYELSVVNFSGRLLIKFKAEMIINGEQAIMIPDPPLNIELRHEGQKFSFRKQIDDLVEKHGQSSIIAHIKNLANQRNKILYASHEGYPAEIQITDKFFPAYQRRVFAMLRAYLMIQPYPVIQPMVQDSIDAFLSMLETINLDGLHEEF